LIPSRLLAAAVAEVGTTGRALREALAVAVAPPTTQELELQAKEIPVVLEADGQV
jgi:hypothetical protein